MNHKNTKYLLKKYPKLFAQYKLPLTQTAMCWGLQCGDGWFWLINLLCSQLQFDIDINKQPQIEFTTIKEKFGTLRMYTQGASEREEGMIDLICFMSSYVCENCGSTDDIKQTKGNYIQSLCTKCRKKRKG